MKKLLIFLLLFFFFILTSTSSLYESPIDDEPIHITTGFLYLKYGNLDFNSGSPILANVIFSSPLFLISNSLKIPTNQDYFQRGYGHGFGREFLMLNRNNVDLILFLVRMPVMIAGVLLGLIIFIWIKRWYGYLPGLLGLALYVTEPNIIANSHYAALDIFLALFFTATLFFLHLFIFKNEKKYFILFVISFVFTQLTKVTALFLFPICFFIFYFYSNKVNIFSKFKQSFFRILILAFITFIGINTFYGWRDMGLPLEQYLKHDNSVINHREYPMNLIESKLPFYGKPLGKISEYFYKEFPMPITYQYVKVLGWTFFRTSYPQPAFLAGHYFTSGWLANFPLMSIIKMPVTLLFLFFASIILTFIKKRKVTKEELAFIIMPLVIFISIFTFSRLFTAYRYMIFLVPLILLFTTSTIKNLSKGSLIFFVIIFFQFYIAVSTFPNFLGFANFIDQRDKYKYLTDSNLDWGQDIKRLSIYIKENKIKSIKQNLYGLMNTELYNVSYDRFGPPWVKEDGGPIEDCEPKGPGLYAISASQLTGTSLKNHNCFDWLIERGKMLKVIGSSIYIYKI